jgi:Holliday junction resolvase-like predicted endonuclease
MKGSCSETSAKNWLKSRNWSIESNRVRIAHVEVDFLARDPSGLLYIIEVKSAGALARGIVSYRQRRRLERVAQVLAQKEPVMLLALVVEKSGQVMTVPLY